MNIEHIEELIDRLNETDLLLKYTLETATALRDQLEQELEEDETEHDI